MPAPRKTSFLRIEHSRVAADDAWHLVETLENREGSDRRRRRPRPLACSVLVAKLPGPNAVSAFDRGDELIDANHVDSGWRAGSRRPRNCHAFRFVVTPPRAGSNPTRVKRWPDGSTLVWRRSHGNIAAAAGFITAAGCDQSAPSRRARPSRGKARQRRLARLSPTAGGSCKRNHRKRFVPYER